MELTILGAGIFGLSIAWEAAQKGVKTRVIDPNGIGAGASGGLVGALAPHAPETWNEAKAAQLAALLQAQDWWDAVEAAAGVKSGYGRTGRVQPVMDERGLQLAAERAENAKTLWQGRAYWQLRPADRATDPVSPTGMVVEDTLTARISPRLGLAALAKAIRAKGGQIVTEGPQEGIVIHAYGAAGLRDLTATLGRDIGRGEKGQALSLAFDMADAPQIYAPGLHIVPHIDGTVAIGSTSERHYEDAKSTDEQLDVLYQKALEAFPALASAPILERWAGERPRAVTRKLVLGAYPEREGHFVANGGFKTGFAMAPLAARIILDLALDGRDTIPETMRLA